MSKAYMLGISHRLLGKSIAYNPFLHKGSSKEYLDWEKGWLSQDI